MTCEICQEQSIVIHKEHSDTHHYCIPCFRGRYRDPWFVKATQQSPTNKDETQSLHD